MLSARSVWLVRVAAWLALANVRVPANAATQQWPSWRGPHEKGSTASGDYPVHFNGTSNLVWKAPLPGKGCSTPAVWNHQIFLTAPANGEDSVLSFDWAGHNLWLTPLGPESAGKNRNGSGSNPSPVTDGRHIFVYFKSGNLAALDFAGRVQWKANLVERYGRQTLYWDYGSSPVLTETDVIVSQMHHGESWLAAFDKSTGRLRWKTPRNYTTPEEDDHSYASPLTFRQNGVEEVLVWGAEHLTAYRADDGHLLWSCGTFNPQEIPNWVSVASPIIAGDIAVVPCGRGTRLHGIKLGGSGDVTATARIWVRTDTGTFVTTPAEYQGLVYLVRDRGEVECIDPATGKTRWRGAFPRSSANYYSSPVIANGNLYAAREDGVVFVGRVGEKFEVRAENRMEESIIASPVPVDNRLLLRGEKHLFCIGEGTP